MGKHLTACVCLQQCPPDVLASPEVKLAVRLHQALQANRWVAFFGALATAPYLAACLGNMYSPALRASALCTLMKSLGEHFSAAPCISCTQRPVSGLCWGPGITALPGRLPGQHV